MSSPNISFDTIGTNRKPGQYFEFNTRLAVRTLPGNTQKVLMIAPMLASGSSAPLVIQNVFSDEEAATYFGRGSMAHLMATAAIGAYPTCSCRWSASAMRPLQQQLRARLP